MRYIEEKIIPAPDLSFHCHDVVGDVIECDFHVHPEYEIVYIVSSFGTLFVGDSVGTFDAGDLMLIGPMVPHHFHNSPQDSVSDEWGHAKLIQFKRDFAGSVLFQLPEMRAVRHLLDASIYGLAFPSEVIGEALKLMVEVFDAQDAARVASFLKLLDFLSESPYKKLSTISGNELQNITSDTRLNEVLRYIHDCLEKGRKVTLEKTASKINMTPQAFSRYFRKTTFKRFIDYVNEIRVGKASRLLLNTDKTIAEICYEAGFNNLSNFNRQFQKVKNMPPKAFRASLRRFEG